MNTLPPPEKAIPTWLIIFIILTEGFVTVSAEVLTIRQLIPMAGGTVLVTSLIIGILLLFLAYGYQQGGRYTHGFRKTLTRNFFLSAVILAIGLSTFFINYFFIFLNNYVTHQLLIQATCYLLFITAPLVYLLGQTLPIVTNLFNPNLSNSAINATALHLSTIGAFLGSLLTALIFMNYVGVAWTIFINFCLLLTAIVFLMSPKEDKVKIGILIIAFIFSLLITLQIRKLDQHDISTAATLRSDTIPGNLYFKKMEINPYFKSLIPDNSAFFMASKNNHITAQSMTSLFQSLSTNQIAVIATISSPMLADAHSQQINHIILSIFHYCLVVPLRYQKEPTEVVYFCNPPNSKPDPVIYTDDLNVITIDYFNLIQKYPDFKGSRQS